ncbi:MAG: hypothetical protein J5598_03220 [Clostridia bacterium]|nr:hypothetical protein [Clostridia bacterium]
MPINKETIISVFTEKLTLEQWLKTINKALDEAVLTGVQIAKKGNATLSFKFTFEDGTFLESNDIVLQQGESVNGAYIQNGHLYLTLTNDTILDAGNVKPVTNFSIDASQHLIVNYGDGTSQDLGPIFNGNVNIAGNFTANSIIENMTGYDFTAGSTNEHITRENIYAGIVKNGNKLTIVGALNLTRTGALSSGEDTIRFGIFDIPSNVADKLYPTTIGLSDYLDLKHIKGWFGPSLAHGVDLIGFCTKGSQNLSLWVSGLDNLELNEKIYIRYEVTLLLSNNLIS